MPTKPEAKDGIFEANQVMRTSSYAIQCISRCSVLGLKQLFIVKYTQERVNLASILELWEILVIFAINNILCVSLQIVLNLWIELKSEIRGKSVIQVDHVYKEKKENFIKFLDDNDCPEDLQRISGDLDSHSRCYVTDVNPYVGTFTKDLKKVPVQDGLTLSRIIYLSIKRKSRRSFASSFCPVKFNKEKTSISNKYSAVQKIKAIEAMLEKKITCNGSTAATTLINLNANVSKSNSNASTSGTNTTVSNSNNKSSTSSAGGTAVETIKPTDVMAIKTEDISLRNTCKTEIDSEKTEPTNVTNGPPVSTASVCDATSGTLSNASSAQNTSSGSSTSASNVNGKNKNSAGDKSKNVSPEVSPQAREIKNEGGIQQQPVKFVDSQTEGIAKASKDNVATNKGAVTPSPCASAIKTEIIPNTGGIPSPAACGRTVPPCPQQNVGPPGLSGPQNMGQSPSVTIQPLPSNMVNKSSTSIESQYMQQQSQIFVFSTGLANKAAEAVLSEHYPSIISFHCAQPGTVRFLEKHPLKVQQFHRQSSAMWLNNLAQMKQGNRQMKLGPMNPMQNPLVHHQFPGGPCGQCHGPCNQPAHGPRMPMGGGPRGPVHQGMCHGPPHPDFGPRNNWNPMNGANMNCDPRFPNQHGNRPMFHPGMGPHCGDPMGGEYNCNSDHMGPCSAMDSSKLNSVKVPDENLTPEQRQHRKEQLVILRNLGQLLLPDLHNPGGNEPQNSQNQMMANHLRLGNPQGLPPHCHGEMCNHPGSHPLQHQGGCGNDVEGLKQHPLSPAAAAANHFAQQKMMMGPNCSSGDQNDWQRSNNFFDEANSKCGPSLSQSPQAMNQNQPPHLSHHPITPQSGIKQQQPSLNSSSPNVGASPNSTVRVQGPPPPYHQGSRCPVVSPHPASPSTVSLSSPHMASGLPSPVDPSRSFPHPPTSSNRLSHPSPGGGSLQSTPLSSPKPSNPPNSGTMPKSSTTPIPISTPTSVQTNSSMNNLAPSPGSGGTTTTSSTNRKRATTPGSVTQQSVDMEYGPLSQPLTPSSDSMMFGSNRSLHLCGQSPRATPKPADSIGKEPSLMPVPSPQQIQYLNAFEGQELTIQKQPNTSIRETELLPQNVPPNGSEGVNPNFPPFPGPDMGRNSFGNMQGPGMGPGPCNSSLCSCGEGSHPRFQQMQNNENLARMYPGPHPGMQHMEMQRFRGGVPMNFQNQVPGAMPRFATAGMDHRYRGPAHIQNEMGPNRYPGNFGGPQRMDGMMIRNQFMPGNGNTEPILHRQYSSPGPNNMAMFDGHPSHPHPHNMPNLQKTAGPFDNSKTLSPLGSGMAGDDSSSSMGLTGGSQRLSHFDPIASMTAMSDTALPSPGLNRNQNPNSPVMNVPNMRMGNSPLGCNQGPPMNFNPNAQSMHVNQSNINNNMMHGQQGMPFGSGGGQNLSPAPRQNVNTFVNATMSIQQLNIQNATTSNYNHRQAMSPSPGMMQMQQVSGPQGSGPGNMMPGGNNATSNQPMMHGGTVNANKMGGPRSVNNLQQFPGSPVGVPKRGSSPLPQGNPVMMPRNPGAIGSPGYLSPNVHVKASAPNTIQYLPARPQNCSSVSNRPPSLDFLQRYASPLTNLDSKVPTHNLQYFPSAGPNNGPNGMQLPSPGGDSGPSMPGHDLDGQTRSMGQINRNHMNFIGGPPTPNHMGQPMSAASPMLSDPNDFNNRTTGVPMGNNGPNPMGIFHNNKNLPLSPSGLAPDTTQPLPSSMGQTLNYKQSPFYGPTTADPNYAVQFHNFQQQLYATNTRGNPGNNPNLSANPSFFNLK